MNFYKKITVPAGSRLFIFGDLHGEYDAFMKYLVDINFHVGKDVCVVVGDLIDRGPKSFELLQLFAEDTTGSFYSVLGNHEDMAMAYDDGIYFNSWMQNGGRWALQKMVNNQQTKDECYAYLKTISELCKKLPIVLDITHGSNRIGVCHAAVPTFFKTWDSFINAERPVLWLQQILWDRNLVRANDIFAVEGIDYVVHGHNPITEIKMIGNRIHIDTGFHFCGNLSMVISDGNNITLRTEKGIL